MCGITGVSNGIDGYIIENCALLGYYAASSGNYYHHSLRNNPEEELCSCRFISFVLVFRAKGD